MERFEPPGVTVASILDALPYFAMIIDPRHRVIAANTWYVREAWDGADSCPLMCHEGVHGTSTPHDECPLYECVTTGKPSERVIGDGRHGNIKVSIYPLAARGADGSPLYLHLAQPV